MISEQLQKKIDRSIKLLQGVANGYDGVMAIENTWGEGDWLSLEDSGVSFDRYNEGKNVVYIGW